MAHAEVLDFSESQSLKGVQAHLESTHSNAQPSARTNEGKGGTSLIQHTEQRLSYVNGRKVKIKNRYNLT